MTMGFSTRLRHLANLLTAFAMAGALAGCAAETEPTLYLLDLAEAPASGTVTGPPIGLREVELPQYARRPQIALLSPDGSLQLSDLNRWAEEPNRAISRLISRLVSAETGRVVLVEPWPPETAPDTRVEVSFDLLVGGLGGTVRAEGQYRVIPLDRSRAPVLHPFALSEPVSGPEVQDLVSAHRRVVERLASEIAASMR